MQWAQLVSLFINYKNVTIYGYSLKKMGLGVFKMAYFEMSPFYLVFKIGVMIVPEHHVSR